MPECIHQNHIFRARPLSVELSSKFISWWGNSFGKNWFQREGKQTTNLASINLTKLSHFPIPVPPAFEQQRIAFEIDRLLSIVDGVQREIHTNLQRGEQLKATVLSIAFGDPYPRGDAANVLIEGGPDVKSSQLPELPAPRESEADDHRTDLIAVLSKRRAGMTLEQLFVEGNYRGDQVDQFYRDLARIRGEIEVTVPRDSRRTWPFDARTIVRYRK